MSKINDNFRTFSEYGEVAKDFLSSCQTIEAGLRLYIIYSYELIRRSLDNKLPFHLDEQDVNKDSMGTLIEKFSKLTNNSDLVSRLKELTPYRNRCAHHAFVLSVKDMRSDNPPFESHTSELKEMFDKSESVYAELVDEYRSIRRLLKEGES